MKKYNGYMRLGTLLAGAGNAVSTQSAQLSTASAELNSEIPLLTTQEATVSGNLMVLGKTTVADLGVTGKITSGLLVIDG